MTEPKYSAEFMHVVGESGFQTLRRAEAFVEPMEDGSVLPAPMTQFEIEDAFKQAIKFNHSLPPVVVLMGDTIIACERYNQHAPARHRELVWLYDTSIHI